MMFDVISNIGDSIDIMTKLYHNLIDAFTTRYALDYHKVDISGDEAQLDNKKFRLAIRDIINDKEVEEKLIDKMAKDTANMKM